MSPVPRRRKKHIRTRTGCLTCRKRRIKSDEEKPICRHCTKSSRECAYPISVEGTRIMESSKAEHLPTNDDSKSDSDPDLSYSEEKSCQEAGVSRSSALISSPTIGGTFKREDDDVDESRNYPEFHVYKYTSSVPDSLTTKVKMPSFRATSSGQSPLHLIPIDTISIPRSPKSSRHSSDRYFMKFHQDAIMPAHYFAWHDQHHLYKTAVPAMAEESTALRSAVLAFSALIYSMKVEPALKEVAYFYYASALRELRFLLDFPLEPKETHIAVATTLQLSSFDRFLGDASKCFRHLEGAARILQRFSTPIEQSSSILGRSLLVWYWTFEVYFCFVSAKRILLPSIWGYEHLRIRQELPRAESMQISEDERKAELLDDQWAKLFTLIPNLVDIVASIPQLLSIGGSQYSETVSRLQSQLESFRKEFLRFTQSAQVLEVLQAAEHPAQENFHHSTCCPPLPFTPHHFQYSPAAHLQLSFLCIQIHMQTVLYPVLRPKLELDSRNDGMEDENAEHNAYEICRTFAGLEYIFGEDQDELLPCFSLLVPAGFCCPPNIRSWLWCKFAHFEKLCSSALDPIKKTLSVYWDMPNLVMEGFSAWKSNPPDRQLRNFHADDVDLASKLGTVNLDE